MSGKPLTIWNTVIPENWIDYNSHMTEGYYGVAFANASDEFLIHIGFDSNYRTNHGTFYTVEAQIRFLEELKEGSAIHTETILIGCDSKRIQLHHALYDSNNLTLAATQEAMLLHVTIIDDIPSVSEIQEPLIQNLIKINNLHSEIDRPDYLGNGIRQIK
jgi:acyl-CoA thioesterase FadM